MACAADMAKAGCDVTVYEAFHEPGGVLKYGIPDFRLPNTVIDAEIDKLRTARRASSNATRWSAGCSPIEQMIDEMGFDAVFVGVGAGYPTMLDIPGDSLNGVLSANELLTRCNLMRGTGLPELRHAAAGRQARGRGRRRQHRDGRDAGVDAARLPTRSTASTGARARKRRRALEEVHHAEQEGIEFHWLTNPVAVLDDGKGGVRGMRCVRMELGEPDESGPAPPGPGRRQRVRLRDRPGGLRDRHQRQSDHGPDVEAEAEQVGLHRDRRQPCDLDRGGVRRRRHRHRRRDGDPGDGRGPQGRAQHEGLPGHPRSGAWPTTRTARTRSSASTPASAISRGCG